MTLSKLKCDVCGDKGVGAASSSLGAVSLAYCKDCEVQGCEPYGVLVLTVAELNGLENCAEFVAHSLEATLVKVNKSREQFDKDVEEAKAEMAEERKRNS